MFFYLFFSSEKSLEEEGEGGRAAPHFLHAAHSLFPSVLCSSVMQIVACLDDAAVSSDGCAVYEVAYQVKFPQNLFNTFFEILFQRNSNFLLRLYGYA